MPFGSKPCLYCPTAKRARGFPTPNMTDTFADAENQAHRLFPTQALFKDQEVQVQRREEGRGRKASPAGGRLTVLGSQHGAHRGKEFVQRGVHRRGEIRRVVVSQGHQQAVAQELRRQGQSVQKSRHSVALPGTAVFPALGTRTPSPPYRSQILPGSPRTHLEVDGIHTQLVGVQVAQSRQSTGQVIEVVCGIGQRISDLLAVSLDLGGAVAYIKVREVGLGGGEASEHPVRK